MADKTYVAVAAQYPSEESAVADFDAIRAHYKDDDRHDHAPLDAAVIARDFEGKLTIVRRDDGNKSHGARKGLAVGLASGLAVALFPAVALGGALLVAGGSGAGIGAIAGHIGRKTPTKDLEAISETLHAGSAGIVFVIDPADTAELETLLGNATAVTQRDLSVDDSELDDEVDGAYE
ncbi:hypothetical protein N3K63_12410 [Microbacterium sp. W1N]|uniref:hypothetical protein n=1 Tax=Microbacterium festucae TaxID=2977531 RepID=UPI0021C16AD2|nr:hypothetical protein [Microbacterium festucae]MCT9821081.1 hypothetical protein [Microbacterium festucae]